MRRRDLLLMFMLLCMGWGFIQIYLFSHKPQSLQRFKSSRAFSWFIPIGDESFDIRNGDHHQHRNRIMVSRDKMVTAKPIITTIDSHDAAGVGRSDEKTQTSTAMAVGPTPFNFDIIASQVERLERDLSQQTKSTEVLLRLLKKIESLARAMNKTVAEVIADRTANGGDLRWMLEPPTNQKPVICVLLFACNRVTVRRSLEQLFKYRPDAGTFPIVVSQDCNHEPTRQIIQSYGERLKFIQQPDQSDIVLQGKNQKKFKGYYKIARHYGWALNETFNVLNYDTVLIVEDDLDIAPDFFEYFLALYPLLRNDPSLYCISAWNDNGKDGLVEPDPTKLYRSDFFPGLGWMLTKDLWLEFQHKWPKAFWDDWIRQPEQRKNRACIRPEISRTKTFGKKGVSNGLFFEKHLKFIKLNEEYVPFTKRNLSYLLKENYDVEFLKQVYTSRLIPSYEVRNLPPVPSEKLQLNHNGNDSIVAASASPLASPFSVRIQYDTRDQFKKAAKKFGLMDDFKSGVPRTGYLGTVGFMHHGYRVYLAPGPLWSGYNVTWK